MNIFSHRALERSRRHEEWRIKTKNRQNVQTYGVPLYAVDWIPKVAVRSKIAKDQEDSEGGESSSSSWSYIVLSGGVGEGRSGIPNVILICRIDLATNSLSEQPLGRLVVGSDLPYRMAVHPLERGLICAFPNSCRLFDRGGIMSPREDNLAGEKSVKVIKELEVLDSKWPWRSLRTGLCSQLGGTLRVFEWPNMKMLITEPKAHDRVESLTFSKSGRFLVSLGRPFCRVWDVKSSGAVASLSKEKDEMFASCRFSVDSAGNEVLYIAANTERCGSIITWDTKSWKRKGSKLIENNSISAFNVSSDGKLLAIGTPEGDVLILDSMRMQPKKVAKKAHLGLVTALTFSPDFRCLVSVSIDSRAKLTMIEQKVGGMLWVVVLLFRVAMRRFGLFHEGKGDHTFKRPLSDPTGRFSGMA